MSGARAWRFLVDRGGTFTDVVAIAPDGARSVRKVLSDDGSGVDPVVRALREITGRDDPGAATAWLRMGTTVATNALLERRTARMGLIVTRGHEDVLVIGTQQRPSLFELRIDAPAPLHDAVAGAAERTLADGAVERALDEDALRAALAELRARGVESVAVSFLHALAAPGHERRAAELAREAGFDLVVEGARAWPEASHLARTEAAVMDAALSPVVRRALAGVRDALGDGVALQVMQSSGGLVRSDALRGRDAVLSGPAGGAVAVAALGRTLGPELGFDAVLGLDMGGTSTDVSRWSTRDGLERAREREVAGLRVRAPLLDVVTVAAGGGSLLGRLGGRLVVGPASAGSSPGPAAYGRGGPATVTDANIVLGRLDPAHVPACFGPSGRDRLDADAARAAVARAGSALGLDADAAAAGAARLADQRMALAIRELSVARGHDPRAHVLACFGGAAGQHACALAASLGMTRVIVPAHASVLSAWGMGVADVLVPLARPVLAPLDGALAPLVAAIARDMADAAHARLAEEGVAPSDRTLAWRVQVRHRGAEADLDVPLDPAACDAAALRARVEERHAALFGFTRERLAVDVVALHVEARGALPLPPEPPREPPRGAEAPVPAAAHRARVLHAGQAGRLDVPVVARASLAPGARTEGPALVVDPTTTVVLDPGWSCEVHASGALVLESAGRTSPRRARSERDPVTTEVFGSAFTSIAEQMGEALRRTSLSTNVKERLDYSCAVFTRDGALVANAPHVPVHLGAMGATVRAVLAARGERGLRDGLVVASNDPYAGGSHLPDVTVVTPVFVAGALAFVVANRAHHADVGGVAPGSMPPLSTTIDEEGVRFGDLTLVDGGRFLEDDVRAALSAGPFPARGIDERIADLRAQAAANALGATRLRELVDEQGAEVVEAQMGHVLADAEDATRELLARLPRGVRRFADALDDGTRIAVAVEVGDGRAVIDFTGTSGRHAGNLNAPAAISTACVLYVVRCLLGRALPLNEGCLRPLAIVVPRGSLLDPVPPAAVCGGNVETSMRLADVLLAAFEAQAASQGTMNNVTFGDATFGYYETLGGGAGAGPGFHGASAVHSHLTNTRLTDAEVLERRHPVIVRETSVRAGSGGAGRWRGGDGLVRVLEARAPLDVAILSERRATRPFGLAGGGPGSAGRNRIVRADGGVEELAGRARSRLSPGDALRVETPGGGAWGSADACDDGTARRTDAFEHA